MQDLDKDQTYFNFTSRLLQGLGNNLENVLSNPYLALANPSLF